MNFAEFIAHYQQRSNQCLADYFADQQSAANELLQAMRYAVLNGGKRLRALLVYATGLSCGAAPALLDSAATAIELVHAYSLVHDDLPAMDDDDWRRGKPSCHKAFNEALAILAGDALQSAAFATLAQPIAELSASQQLQMLSCLAQAIGCQGMAGGQALDLAAEGKPICQNQLETIHRGKTGALIIAAVELGAIAGAATPQQQQQLRHFAAALGLAFQIQDDVLDIEGDAATLGKTPGVDLARRKATYPALMGLAQTKAYTATLYQQALQHLAQAQIADSLLQPLAAWSVQRKF